MPYIPFCWDADSLMEHNDEWIIDLTDELNFITIDKCLTKGEHCWQHYKHDGCPQELKRLSQQIQELVLHRTGIALLKCGSKLSSDQARLIQLMLGCEFGENITKTAQGDDRPLFALHITKDPTAKGQYYGNGLKGNQIGFHTDGSGSTDREVKLLSMLCICQARFGGQSRIANSQLAFEHLPPAAQEFLQQDFPRQNPYDDKLAPHELKRKPIFRKSKDEGLPHMYFSYHPDRVRNGLKQTKGSLEKQENDTFCLLEETLEKFSCDINLMANEILFLNNRVIAHDRRRFWDDPKAGRWLERFWAGNIMKPITN
jgi:hypothetical protein